MCRWRPVTDLRVGRLPVGERRLQQQRRTENSAEEKHGDTEQQLDRYLGRPGSLVMMGHVIRTEHGQHGSSRRHAVTSCRFRSRVQSPSSSTSVSGRSWPEATSPC